MQKSDLFKSLTPDLAKRIASADLMEPYVWRLKLSAADFEQLELAITHSISENGGRYAHLISADSAWVIMVYLAEWYKRRYSGGESTSGQKAINPESSELKKLWELSGIDINTFVYTSDKGDRLWQYSMYVLGGLGIRHELGRKQSSRFLKQLCRLLNNENGILEADEFKEDNRAISFRGSIVQKHSLYEFLNDIIGHKLPFSDEDIINPASEVNRFITAIQEANNAVIRDKFDFEWVVRQAPENDTIERWLKVSLRPELNGGLHEELHIQRFSKWGIQNPGNLKLSFSIRFLDGDNCIATSTPFANFWSTGDKEQRLIKWGAGTPKVKYIPTSHFDSIEIVAEDVVTQTIYGNIQRESVGEYMQFWRIDDFQDEWSSKNRSQKDTAVLFSDAYSLAGISEDTITRKPIRGRDGSNTVLMNWYFINESVTLIDESDKKVTLHNRQGYDHLHIRTYDSIIRYLEGGQVPCTFLHEDEMEEIRNLPLVFQRDDIRAIHYETRDAEFPDKDTTPELIQFKARDSSRYEDWTAQNEPPFGPMSLRVLIKEKDFKMEVFHLPSIDFESPIIRDYSNSSIRYSQFQNDNIEHKELRDEIVLNKENPLKPTVSISIQASAIAYAVIDVYRPTLVKELIVDGRVLRYIQEGEKLKLPYILKYRSSINDFSRNGYSRFTCSSLPSIYKVIGDPRIAWQNAVNFEAEQLDSYAPKWLNIVFGDSLSSEWLNTLFGNSEILNQTGRVIYYWDYRKDVDPQKIIPAKEEMAKTSLLFESMIDPTEGLSCMFPHDPQSAFGYNGKAVSMLTCFETAMKHETYFFIFWPLSKRLKFEEYVPQIYEPLLEKREGKLTEKDIAALRRFAEEFRFEWKEFGIIFKTI